MSTISELLKEKKTLPSGNVYAKTINGKKYYYHQYFKDGKRYSKLVPEEQVTNLIQKIVKRIELEGQIKEKLSKEKVIRLSKNATNLTGFVMSGNIPVTEFSNGELLSINNQLAPLSIRRTHSLEKFLSLRVIDMSRTNARLLKKALNISVDEDYKIALYAYALSICDNFWFKPKHSKIKFNDLILKSDSYSDLSLKGDTNYFPCESNLTPELTTTGSFEKGWKLIDDSWWLYKSGNNRQIFSELFCYHFAELIGVNTAKYELDGKYIRSLNFADKYNFEPMAALADNNDNYEYVFALLYQISPIIAKDYLKLMLFDATIYNVDRHNENYGILRDRNTGEVVSLAPNFDNNLALVSNEELLKNPTADGLIKLFVKFIKNNPIAKQLFIEINWKSITKEDIESIIKNMPIHVDKENDLVEKVLSRYNYLINSIR